jgi:hypothetical protein
MTAESLGTSERAQIYAQNQNLKIEQFLGSGFDGSVFATNRKTAIKALKWQELYQHERDIYLRLRQYGIKNMAGCHIPQLILFDDELWTIEMTIVSPPYVLDFAGARLDQPTEYPPNIYRRWIREKRSQFGSKWKYVPRIVTALQRIGVYLSDLNPGNICLDGYPKPEIETEL